MKTIFVLSAALAVTTIGLAHAAQWPNLPGGPAAEATVWDADPQWPNLAGGDAGGTERRVWEGEARWPSRTAPTDQAEQKDEGHGSKWEAAARWPGAAADDVTGAIGGPAWPAIAPPAVPSFAFEIGARYWYSSGTTRFGFTNGDAMFGNPTSTLDWNHSKAHAGEVFGRIDHLPTGVFVKGLIGAGTLGGGSIIDRDFFVDQIKFSDTSSAIDGDDLRYAVVDVGWAFDVPAAGVRLGGFVGYHYWRENLDAYGLLCNGDDVGGAFCGPPGVGPLPRSTEVLRYQPTWNALRVGFDARYQITPSWSFAGEVAFVPYARLENQDSHLLRQDMTDLGPAPNVISRSDHGWGGEIEAFVNYAVHPNIEIGLGGRYWALAADRGNVRFGPDFIQANELTRFEQQRLGVLVQVKGRF